MINNLERGYFYNFGRDLENINRVEERLNRIKKMGYFKGENDLDIYYETYIVEREKGRIVISHGFCECLEKYKEIIYYFIEEGYSVFGIEHRGHGRSGHLSKKYKSQVNVEKFDYYIEDLKRFLDQIVKEKGKDLYLYAHSMGGAIGTLFLETYPGYFKKAVLNAPMMQINTGKYSNFIAELLAKFYIAIGKGDNYIFGHKDFDGIDDLEGSGTSDKYRYMHHLSYLSENKECQRGGGSFRWVNEGLKATRKLLKEENIKKIDIPILLFQAGNDTFVVNEAHNEFKAIAKDCAIVYINEGKHELYFERDSILHSYLDRIFNFYEQGNVYS